jgi:hypothetical protein
MLQRISIKASMSLCFQGRRWTLDCAAAEFGGENGVVGKVFRGEGKMAKGVQLQFVCVL